MGDITRSTYKSVDPHYNFANMSATRSKLSDPQLGILKLDNEVEVVGDETANAQVNLKSYEKLQLSVDQYRFFKEHGWIKIPSVFTEDDLTELNTHLDRVLTGEDKIPGCDIDPSLTYEERQSEFSRIHMLHRRHALHEKYLLHPRVLDVVEQLSSPDILAL